MPSQSIEQQRLFAMAYAVRTNQVKRNDVSQAVLDLVDSDMTDDQIRDFATSRVCECDGTMMSLREFAWLEML